MKIGTDGVLLGAWTRLGDARDIVDAGAGSALISLMLAQRCPDARITAIELDAAASIDARANIDASPWADRVRLVDADFTTWNPAEPPTLIVSNPPFFSETLKSPSAGRALARHGETFNPYTLIDRASAILAADGSLAMISTAADGDDVLFHAELRGLKLRRECRVQTVAGKPVTRLLRQFARTDGDCQVTTLTLRERSGAFTHAYRELTADFYLHF